jgi:hypothetical protein
LLSYLTGVLAAVGGGEGGAIAGKSAAGDGFTIEAPPQPSRAIANTAQQNGKTVNLYARFIGIRYSAKALGSGFYLSNPGA